MAKNVLTALSQKLIGTITHVDTQDPIAALTFDDGPDPEYTPLLLDLLQKHQVRGTFFMVGEAAQRHPEIVRQVAQAGHVIGNHSWDHPSFVTISGRVRRQQIRACANSIAPYGQRLFRPPWGHQNLASCLDALWLGYKVVGWNASGQDWSSHDAKYMAERLIRYIKPGSIILLHDAIYKSQFASPEYDRHPMHEALDMVLTHFKNYIKFVTILELFQHGRPVKRKWIRKG